MILRNGKEIQNGGKPYIVAELNSSHRGKTDQAKQMIDSAKACGCDAVKFQSWTAESLYCEEYYKYNPMAKRLASGVSLSRDQLFELSGYCKEVGIDFASTPYSKDEVDFLADVCRAPYIKVASMDIDNIPFLKYIAKKNIAIVLSTGMASIDEIETAVKTIETAGNENICILHCVSVYPVEPANVNLRNMVMLKEHFPECTVGYSDHTAGSEVACAAVALGAGLIEKHFTLDNRKIGWDNQMATEPDVMQELVNRCQNVYVSLGSYDRVLSEDELTQRSKMRRSLVAARNLTAGETITANDMDAKRPGDGISVEDYEQLIGKKLKTDVTKDFLLRPEFFE